MSSDQKHQISCLVWDPEPDCADHIGPNSFKSHRFVVCDELFKMFSLLKLEMEAGGVDDSDTDRPGCFPHVGHMDLCKGAWSGS